MLNEFIFNCLLNSVDNWHYFNLNQMHLCVKDTEAPLTMRVYASRW